MLVKCEEAHKSVDHEFVDSEHEHGGAERHHSDEAPRRHLVFVERKNGTTAYGRPVSCPREDTTRRKVVCHEEIPAMDTFEIIVVGLLALASINLAILVIRQERRRK